ncbi:mucoidy inhibitor MuiA family protein [Persicobacter diffluens]|uniref:DUF4139 domain-containing protein n=1 Tax=Persicobacter diffluens TaxID=981 RepID=A0AAN5ALI4_9BACT|nr:hypothetical protein PEDI_45520 [Persicobacter diffluens]
MSRPSGSISGEVWVRLHSDKAQKIQMELDYIVKGASWFPTYDIKAESIEKPIELRYKANIQQNTGVDWSKVKLTLSSGDPSLSNQLPELKTYFLDYNRTAPQYNKEISKVSGIVRDQDNKPLPGASVRVKGSTISSISDINGYYQITLPQNARELEVKFIGYEPNVRRINAERMDFKMMEDVQALEEVVVVGYGTPSQGQLAGAVSGINIRKSSSETSRKKAKASNIKMEDSAQERSIHLEYTLTKPYSLKSDNSKLTVDMVTYELPVEFQYHAVPKLDPNAFLIARMYNWEQYNFMPGEASLYFEHTFIGTTVLDTQFAKDTLEFSLGRDKSIFIERKAVSPKSTKKVFNARKQELRDWDISVKNNKRQDITLYLKDQIPVSQSSEIEVELLDKSGAKMNPENGVLQWELKLAAGKSKDLKVKYVAKFHTARHFCLKT